MKPHKHAELIKAWADGAEIQVYYEDTNDWKDCSSDRRGFNWYENLEYRIKPEPKPDFISHLIRTSYGWAEVATPNALPAIEPTIKLIRDGETGELKDAEVLK